MNDLANKLTVVLAGAAAVLSAIAIKRLLSPRRMRRNHLSQDVQEAYDRDEYDELLTRRCPEHKICVRARVIREENERTCASIEKDAQSKLRDAEQSVRNNEHYVREGKRWVEKAQGEYEAAKKGHDRSVKHFRRASPDQQRLLLNAERMLADRTEAYEDDVRRLQSSRERLLDAEKQAAGASERYGECQLRLQQYVQEEQQLCDQSAQCTSRFDVWETFRDKRAERRRRKTADPLFYPKAPHRARFGVEIEGVVPYNLARDPHAFVAQVVARELGGRKDDRQNVVFDADDRAWHVEHDGSVASGGFELVTPVLEPKDIATVQAVARALKKAGAKSGPQFGAGLHVHVSHPSQSGRMAAIAKAAAKLDRSVPRHPSRHSYAGLMPREFVEAIRPDMDEEDVLREWYAAHGEHAPDPHEEVGKGSPTRYHGVNFHALPYQGTIEVRAFDGTLDPDAIKSAILQSIGMITARENRRRRKVRR